MVDKRTKIFKTAKKMFEKNGYKKVSVDKIVDKVGVAKGTFYLYFESKSDLYSQIFKQILADSIFYMKEIASKVDDVKLRIYYRIVGGVIFVENQPILKQISLGNPDFFSDKITNLTLKENHKVMIYELLRDVDIKKTFGPHIDPEFLDKILAFSSMILPFRVRFESDESYYDFASKYAINTIIGLFSLDKVDFEPMSVDEMRNLVRNSKGL